MSDTPMVSIIMASYNHAEYIAEAIDSVLAQELTDWELFIVDDASTDSTRDVLSEYSDPRIHCHYFSINRQDHPRNYALKQARGQYIAFLNSDDAFLPGKLSKQVDYLESHSEAGAIFTHTRCIDENGEPHQSHPIQRLFEQTNRTRHEWLRWFFEYGNCLCFSSAMIRRSALTESSTAWFDPSFIQMSDFDLWIRICLKYEIWILPEQLTATRVLPAQRNLSADSVSSRNRNALEISSIYQHFLSTPAVEEATGIFPELCDWLPQDTSYWRRYLICNLAAQHMNSGIRREGFQKMQELLSEERAVESLREANPRLMRNFFLSAGSAAIQHQANPTHWVIYLPNKTGSYSEEHAQRYWREFDRQTLCFSFPKPLVDGQIRIDPSDQPVTFKVNGVRLYEQQTGRLIWELLPETTSQITTNPETDWIESDGGWILHSNQPDPNMLLPDMKFQEINGKWLDLELDLRQAVK
ncbi:glycosyltransferase family 2 protein [Rubinisphaera italica]|uniref:Putative teichuronic acid biosynthesis glycosyltransferase TuaG n=1 Tax=Rubinisphaera italica TaxID=2527969 RepID=A0A5C5XAY9_9PLAN|nr:glycosyltransferase [Rubinisphaera italica]TWT60160.1 putative teichuronic acid biosynthesis glycosyltransferase TuaG [Rubinisphaera italica]